MIISKLEKIKETKNRLKEAINAKGGTITDSTPFSEYPDKVSEVGAPQTAKEYYKKNRPKTWPYFPLPSEMTEEDDVIYLLYDATDFRCCPAFSATFTSCTCTLQKYMNTEVVSEETLSLTSGTTMYLQYDDSQEDYNTFNYVLIKLQGNITRLGTYKSKFNGVADTSNFVSELIEVSGKCNACDIIANKFYPCIEYYSFLGVSNTSMNTQFNGCYRLKCIPELDTSSVTNMKNMFYYCYSLQSIPELNTSNVTSTYGMDSMFYGCYSLQSIPELDTSNVTTMKNMFHNCYSLKSIPKLDTSSVTNMQQMFYYCYSLQSIPELDTSSVTVMNSMFYGCASLQSIPELDTNSVTVMLSMFQNCYSLQSIPLLNTSKVANMSNMFSDCSSLQSIPELDTNSVTNMSNMFKGCSSLQRINILNPALSFSISSSTMFQREDLLTILNNLATVTTTQTLTIGTNNLTKLTDADKLIATEKGWTLA